MNTTEKLTEVFNDNFVAYFRSHVAHVNILGRNFYSDHKLLQKIYEDLQDNIDRIAELLRSLNEFMPNNLDAVMNGCDIDLGPVTGNSDELLALVEADLNHLVMTHEELEKIADNENLLHISNYAQDRVLALTKFAWMLKSTLEQ
jgi:DNA-binding ferritin-like protein